VRRQQRKRGRRYYRSGLYALKTTLRALGPRVVNRRTHIGNARCVEGRPRARARRGREHAVGGDHRPGRLDVAPARQHRRLAARAAVVGERV